jgi:hypothetical protein
MPLQPSGPLVRVARVVLFTSNVERKKLRGILMRLPVSVFALTLLTPLAAFAQPAPADPNQPATPGTVVPMPPAPTEAVPSTPPPPPPPPPPSMTPVVVMPAPVAPGEPAKTWKDLLVVDGLVDGYYMYNFTADESLTPPSGEVAVRNFDTNSNTFTLNYAKLGFGVNAEPVGVRVDIGYGATGLAINGNSNPLVVQQAYATLAGGGFTLDFGKFVTTAGAEVIEANKNWNYSRSILFFNIPLLHTGVRGTFKVNDMISLQASIVNGWNGQGFETDVTGDKTFGASIAANLPTGTSIIGTTYIGKEMSDDTRMLFDLVVAQTLGNVGLNLNFDYFKEGDFDFLGVAAMGRLPLHENFVLAVRGEYAQVNDFAVGEGTLTAAIPVGGRYEIRLEGRADFAESENFFGVPPGEMTVPDKKNQVTGTAAVLGWF